MNWKLLFSINQLARVIRHPREIDIFNRLSEVIRYPGLNVNLVHSPIIKQIINLLITLWLSTAPLTSHPPLCTCGQKAISLWSGLNISKRVWQLHSIYIFASCDQLKEIIISALLDTCNVVWYWILHIAYLIIQLKMVCRVGRGAKAADLV